MIINNDEVKAPGTRRSKEGLHSGINSDRCSGVRSNSSEYGNEPFAISGNDWKRANSLDAKRGAYIGKILEQLISSSISQAEELEKGAKNFREQAELLSELLNALNKSNQQSK